MADPTPQKDSFTTQLAAALAAAGAGIGGRALANRNGNPLTQAVPPQLSQLLDQSVQRQAYQNPLFQATTKGAYDMLPTFAKQGTSLSGSLPNTVQPASGTGGGSSGPGLGTAGALGALAALLGGGGAPGSGGQMNLQKIIDGIKKLLQHHKATNGNTGQRIGQFGDWLNNPTDPTSGNTGAGTGDFGNWLDDPGSGLTPNVTTDYNFNNDPNLGAYYPTDYGLLPGYGTDPGGGNAGDKSGTDWWDE